MSYDRMDFEKLNPVYQKESPQPKYKTLSFSGELEDDLEDWYQYSFWGSYYEFQRTIRVVEAKITIGFTKIPWPMIPQEELQNILRIDIREELNTDYSIIFETQIELT